MITPIEAATIVVDHGPSGTPEDERTAVPIPERLLAKLWRQRASRQEGLRTKGGLAVRVLYAGRPGTAAGPDFRDALLQIEGVGTVRGDVELHLRQRDWDAHGHGRDPNYNGVVLHGALQTDSPATRLPSGQWAPVVSLAALLDPENQCPDNLYGERVLSQPERPGPWDVLQQKGYRQPGTPSEAADLLDRAGDQRFAVKARRFGKFLRGEDPEQVLYEGLMEGLGYVHNRQPFVKLAQKAPYALLAAAALEKPGPERAEFLAGLLTGVSGLDPGISSAASRSTRPAGLRAGMSAGEWHRFRVRPPNHPLRRIAGAAHLLARHLETGLVEGLSLAAGTGSPAKLATAVAVPAAATGEPALIGASRARDLAVNAVLPFLHFQSGMEEGCRNLDLFRRFPKLQDNDVTREMASQLFYSSWGASSRAASSRGASSWAAENRNLAGSARRQQGLLHLGALLRGAY